MTTEVSNRSHQLYKIVSSLTLYNYNLAGETHTKNGSNLPHICWPDGTPCNIANLFMLSLTVRRGRGGREGLSRRGKKGGTAGYYANKISQLIRFCHFEKIGVYDLTDAHFSEFIDTLRRETLPFNSEEKRKGENTITATGRVCLDFLNFVGNIYEDETFVHPHGTILAESKDYRAPLDSQSYHSKYVFRTYWHHHTFSSGDRVKSRNPISRATIDLLRETIHQVSSSSFIKERRQCYITLLEHTGARRGELALLKIEDILSLTQQKEPMLKLATLKQGTIKYRMIPVHRVILPELLRYIRIYRNRIVRNTIGQKNDHGYFFVSETTGKILSEETLTSEIYILRKAANINEQSCSHMFRHAFCTNLFCLLIKRNNFETEDNFRQMLIDSETFKMEIIQWTGHLSTKSLDRYIKIAFAESANYAATISSTAIIRAQEAYDRVQDEIIRKFESNEININQLKNDFRNLRENRDADFALAKEK